MIGDPGKQGDPLDWSGKPYGNAHSRSRVTHIAWTNDPEEIACGAYTRAFPNPRRAGMRHTHDCA